MKITTVLSLFDGLSCGQLALNKAKIPYVNYFSSEIDKHSINVCNNNFTNTIQIGDVKNVDIKKLPKIDLLIGGSPCQGFSFAGKMLNFHDPRSSLFFEFVRILGAARKKNPEILFLLENVKMKKEYLKIISEYLQIWPQMVNSNLVSAQNRERYYWTNIKFKKIGLFNELYTDIENPIDKNIQLSDILVKNVDISYFINNFKYEIDSNIKFNGSWGCVKFGRDENAKLIRKEYRKKYKKDYSPFASKKVVSIDYKKMNTLLTSPTKDNILTNGEDFRNLTPIECERLQNIPDNYTSFASDNQRFKMIGNAWTVDIISHIFKHILN